MNIGIVTSWHERGAGYVSRQYKQVLESAHTVFIYGRGGGTRRPDSSDWHGKDVTHVKEIPGCGATAMDLGHFQRWLNDRKIDVVLFNEQHDWLPVLTCNDMGIISGAYIDFYTEETVPLFDAYDFLICNTRRHHSAFEWHPNCWYIPWGTDLDLFKPRLQTAAPPKAVQFFHSAGMSPRRKGTDILLQAFAHVAGEGHLIIHTQRPLRSVLPDFAASIDELEGRHQLTVIEETVSAPGLYHMGDVYVYPSRLEGIGLTIAEALACGLPVITTDAPPMNEFVVPGIGGQLVAVERIIARADGYYWPQHLANVHSLTHALEFYVHHRDQVSQFSAEARRYAEQHLNWQSNATSLNQLLADVKKRPVTETQEASRRARVHGSRYVNFAQEYPGLVRMLATIARPIRKAILR